MAFKDLFKTKSERRAYAIGRKHEKKACGAKRKKTFKKASKNTNKNNVTSKSGFRSIADIPIHYQHNVLFSDDRYANMYRRSRMELGMDHDDARDYSLYMYKKEFGDKVLREHYDL